MISQFRSCIYIEANIIHTNMTARKVPVLKRPLEEDSKTMKTSQLPTRKRTVSGPCQSSLPDHSDYTSSRRRSMIPVPPSNTNSARRPPLNSIHTSPRTATLNGSIPAHTVSKRLSSDQVDTNDYAALLDIQTFQDLAIEKKQLTELLRSINSTDSQIKSLEQEKRQIHRDIRKFKDMIEDCKVNYENLDRTLVIKRRAVDNEVQQHEKLINQSKENVTSHFLKTLNDKENEFKNLLTSSLKDDDIENSHKEELEKIKAEIDNVKNKSLKVRKDNELSLRQLQNELDEKITQADEELQKELRVLKDQLNYKENQLSDLSKELDELTSEKAQRSTKLIILKENINGLSQFQGSLDKVISDMKLKKLELYSELDQKKKEAVTFETGEYSTRRGISKEINDKYQAEKYQRIKIQYQLFEFQNKPRIAVLESTDSPNSRFPEVEFYGQPDQLMDAISVYVEDVLAGVSCYVIQIGKDEIKLANLVSNLRKTLTKERFKRFHYDINITNDPEVILEGVTCFTALITRTNIKSNSDCKSTLSLVSLEKLEHIPELIKMYCEKFRCFTIINGIEGDDKIQLLEQLKTIPFVSKSQASWS